MRRMQQDQEEFDKSLTSSSNFPTFYNKKCWARKTRYIGGPFEEIFKNIPELRTCVENLS